MRDGQPLPSIGSRVLVQPAHIDPTIALHEVMHVVDQIEASETGTVGKVIDRKSTDGKVTDGQVIDTWPVDLRHW
jgi:hypothetical protein